VSELTLFYGMAQDQILVTLDNLLLIEPDAFGLMGGCASLQADVYPWLQMSSFKKCPKRSIFPVTLYLLIFHRNLSMDEKVMSSTERELLAVIDLFQSLGTQLLDSTVTIHTDSIEFLGDL
jgi:hypothetical protein